jgi:hypothetical protein
MSQTDFTDALATSLEQLRRIANQNGGAIAGSDLDLLFSLTEQAIDHAHEAAIATPRTETTGATASFGSLWDATFAAAFVQESTRFAHYELDRPAVREVLAARCAALADHAVAAETERALRAVPR